MNRGDVIAVRGSGPRQVRLLFEVTHDGVDFAVIESADGNRSTPAPVTAALARGYWEQPRTVPAVVKFAPGLRPVLKHGSPGRPGYAAMHPHSHADQVPGAVPANVDYRGLSAATGKWVSEEAAARGVPVHEVEKEFERRIEQARTMPDPYRPGMTAYEGGLDWYSGEAHDHALLVGDGDAAKGAGILSSLSSQNPWPANKNAADCVADMARRGKDLGLSKDDVDAAFFYYQQHHREFGNTGPVTIEGFSKAWRIANGDSVDSVLTGRKRRNFFNNILGDAESVTVDVHMMKALSTTPGSALHGKAAAEKFWRWDRDNSKSAAKKGTDPVKVDGVGYTVAAQAVVNVARRYGLEPRQVQAIVWNTCVKEKWVRPDTGDGGETS